MSRTTRFHYRKGLMRDRARKEIYVANSCSRHGGCGYCLGNRMHRHARAKPIVAVDFHWVMPHDIHFDTDWVRDSELP
ncbi:hypothetical protein [Pseudomonas amygdali]|uniref:Uncharacterized protein n=1 Tax=Pseudomonas amygdali pv. lachrymans str. M301315 TaxID=629260 RepID=A0AAD0PWK4_PSEAV|nr:hypothetical protein [Pseudomonas amygdali]AXH60047.1 hypothetical protein PLA107_033010 [Pseudomonas amygdali pv. lachrymans str. M301315]